MDLISGQTLVTISGDEMSKLVHVLPRRAFEQMCRMLPTQYVVPNGGLDPAALGMTDEPIHKQ